MRISDWSSDVCSSDLQGRHQLGARGAERVAERDRAAMLVEPRMVAAEILEPGERHRREGRSEEHTSELQSLMRISYAVFCLKKKNTRNDNTYTNKTHAFDITKLDKYNITHTNVSTTQCKQR